MAAVRAFVGLGANLGDTTAALRSALQALALLPGTRLQRSSSFYCTAPVDAPGPDYLNAVAELSTTLTAPQLLAELQRIEAIHGRQRPHRHAPRTLDLDLLLYAQQQIESPMLTVPHPRMHERAFVLVPLAEVAAPELEIPGRGLLAELLQGVAGQSIERRHQPEETR